MDEGRDEHPKEVEKENWSDKKKQINLSLPSVLVKSSQYSYVQQLLSRL